MAVEKMTENPVAENSENLVRHESTESQENFITPAVDIFETENGLTLVADMPGLEKDHVNISIDNDILTIRGNYKQSVEREFLWQEFNTMSYFRQFTLGRKIDQESITADYRHGVLSVSLPLAEEAKPRQVHVNIS